MVNNYGNGHCGPKKGGNQSQKLSNDRPPQCWQLWRWRSLLAARCLTVREVGCPKPWACGPLLPAPPAARTAWGITGQGAGPPQGECRDCGRLLHLNPSKVKGAAAGALSGAPETYRSWLPSHCGGGAMDSSSISWGK